MHTPLAAAVAPAGGAATRPSDTTVTAATVRQSCACHRFLGVVTRCQDRRALRGRHVPRLDVAEPPCEHRQHLAVDPRHRGDHAVDGESSRRGSVSARSRRPSQYAACRRAATSPRRTNRAPAPCSPRAVACVTEALPSTITTNSRPGSPWLVSTRPGAQRGLRSWRSGSPPTVARALLEQPHVGEEIDPAFLGDLHTCLLLGRVRRGRIEKLRGPPTESARSRDRRPLDGPGPRSEMADATSAGAAPRSSGTRRSRPVCERTGTAHASPCAPPPHAGSGAPPNRRRRASRPADRARGCRQHRGCRRCCTSTTMRTAPDAHGSP